MKSSFAVPSRLIINTARKLWGSLMHELTILTRMLGYSGKSIMSFWDSYMARKLSSSIKCV